jgi:hypothetical protein
VNTNNVTSNTITIFLERSGQGDEKKEQIMPHKTKATTSIINIINDMIVAIRYFLFLFI